MSIDKFIANSLINIASGLITASSSVLLPILLLRLIGHETFSAWTLVIQFATYIWFLNLGIQNAVSRFVAMPQISANAPQENIATLLAGMLMLLALGMVGFVAVNFAALNTDLFSEIQSVPIRTEAELSVKWVALCFAFMLPVSGINGYFVGMRENAKVLQTNATLKIALLLLMVTFAAIDPTVTSITAAYVFAHLVSLLQNGLYIKRLWPAMGPDLAGQVKTRLVELTKYTLGFIPWSISMVLVGAVTVTLVAKFDYAMLAFYTIATSTITMAMGLHSAIYSNLLPEFASVFGSNHRIKQGTLILESCRLSAVSALIICLPLYLLDAGLYKVITGNAISAREVSVFQLLITASLLRMMYAPYATHLLATNQYRLALLSASLEGIANIAVGYFLAQSMGGAGVAIGMLFGVLVGIAVNIFVNFKRDQHLEVDATVFLLHAMVTPVALASPMLVYVAQQGSGHNNVWAGVACYLACVGLFLRFGLNRPQRAYATQMLAKLKNSVVGPSK
jgi:O-antigen/teichoic acid export membrane protein